MPAESLFDPIPKELIRRAYARLALAGLTVGQWAAANGFKDKAVYGALSGKRLCIRGDSLKIAIALGLRPDPDSPEPQHGLPADLPAGRTGGPRGSDASLGSSLAGGPPAGTFDRRPVLNEAGLGEAVR